MRRLVRIVSRGPQHVLLAAVLLAVSCKGDGVVATDPSHPGLPGFRNSGTAIFSVDGGFRDSVWTVKCERLLADGPLCPSDDTFVLAWRVLGSPVEWIIGSAQEGFAFWIGVATDGYVPNSPGGDSRRYRYTYRVQFDLSGFDLSATEIVLDWAGDNRFDGWRMNADALRGAEQDDGQWFTFKTITINRSNASFVPGRNTLELQLTGDGVTDGVVARVRSVSGRKR